MANSILRYKEKGFWVNDSFLEIAYFYLQEQIAFASKGVAKSDENWLLKIKETLSYHLKGIMPGAIGLDLDGLLDSEHRKSLLILIWLRESEIIQRDSYVSNPHLLNNWNPAPPFRLTAEPVQRKSIDEEAIKNRKAPKGSLLKSLYAKYGGQQGAGNAQQSYTPYQLPVQAKANQVGQMVNDEEKGEAIEDSATYYVTAPDATIRKNSNPSQFESEEIPGGTEVKRIRTFNNGDVAQVEVVKAASGSATVVGTKYWTTFTNISSSATVTDATQYFIAYSDTFIYKEPGGNKETETVGTETSDKKLAVNNTDSYNITARCGALVKVKKGETDQGWVIEDHLLTKTQADRGKYMTDYKTWLEERYTETAALTDTAQTDRIKGILSQAEHVFNEISNGTFPKIADLSKTPTFETHTYTAYSQPELTATVRDFIELLEAGSGTVDTDWNSKLGVPQYRTQSDNLTPPEVTCGPTSFTMGAERLGHSREDAIASIDEKLTGHRRKEYRKQQYLASLDSTTTASGPAPEMPDTFEPDIVVPTSFTPATEFDETDLETKWKTNAKSFFEDFSGHNYQKFRGGTNGGLLTKEEDVAEDFRDWGAIRGFYVLQDLVGL